MIAQDSISRVIETAQIEEVVGDFVSLKRRGVNHVGNCPFHEEKTPSFSVSPSRGIYKCFGCGKAGNSVSFIMEHEKLGFADSIRYLARKYQLPLEETLDTAKEHELSALKESYQIVLDYANSYYQNLLQTDELGIAIGQSYFKERGIKKESIAKWQLGFSKTEWRALADDAEKRGYKKEYLEATGLIKKTDREEWYDIFRERIIFPIHSVQGKVIAFAGRVLKKDDKTAKYLNSPETDFYKKSKVLYGMHLSKNAIKKADKCYLVEGYLDVITMHQEGIENVVAASGTAFTEEQSKLIKRFSENVTVLFDGDAAGEKAAARSIDILLALGLNVRVVAMPEGEDPDSMCKNMGGDKFSQFLNEKEQDFILYKSEKMMEESNNDPIKKTAFVQSILATIALINNPIKRAFYLKECAVLMQMDEGILIDEIQKNLGKFAQKNFTKNVDASKLPADFETLIYEGLQLYEKELVKMLVLFGENLFTQEHTVAQFIINQFKLDDIIFTHELARQIFTAYSQSYEQQAPFNIEYFKEAQEMELQSFINDLLQQKEFLSEGWEKNDIFLDKDAIKYPLLIFRTMQFYKHKRAVLLEKDITDALQNCTPEIEADLIQTKLEVQKIKKETAAQIGNVVN